MAAKDYSRFSDDQVQCILDCIEGGFLERRNTMQHFSYGRRVYKAVSLVALISKGIFEVTKWSSTIRNSYPLCVTINLDHAVVKNIHYVGQVITVAGEDGVKAVVTGITYNEATGVVYLIIPRDSKRSRAIETKQVEKIHQV